MLTFTADGDRLVHLERVDPDDDLERRGPVTHAVVLTRVPGGVLLVRNRARQCWELPGGLRDAGESARACAARELREETGIDAVALRACAVMVLDLQPSRRNPARRQECGAVYLLDHPRSPAVGFSCAEIVELCVRPADRLPPGTGVLDAHLVRQLWPGAPWPRREG